MKSVLFDRITIIVAVMIIFIVPNAFSLDNGEEMPAFSVVSGDGQILIHTDLSEKTVLLFYEDRSRTDLNRELKDYLKGQDFDREEVRTVSVVDCSNAGVFRKIWQNQLVDSSRKNGTTVFGDWNGVMKRDFRFASDTSTFAVIDPSGRVVYIRSGAVPASDFPTIRSFLVP